MARAIGIGRQDFGDIITRNCFYIDKTYFIKEWWENEDAVTLITRPRRFGKTLAMSMTDHFFSVKYAGRGDLFEGLSIWKEETYRRLQGTYPVLFLSFAELKGNDYPKTYALIRELIAQEYNRHFFLMEGSFLTQPEKDAFMRTAKGDIDEASAVMAIKKLSDYLSRYYGKKVIILLDEYDTPMQEAYVGGYWDELLAFMRMFFHSVFKTNPYLERGLLTGITRISKESIFSDLNNLTVIGVTSKKYMTAFGFTEEEVFHALEIFGLQDRKEEVKRWYDGFRFGSCSNIYNPWSIINYLDENELKDYWVNTSSNALVNKLIREGSKDLKLVMEDLSAGKSFYAAIDEQIVFSRLDDDDENAVFSLLLASGYLKIVNCNADEYELKLTNYEVIRMFRKMAHGWFHKSSSGYLSFLSALLNNDLESMNAYMNKVALHTFSSFDSGTKPSAQAEPERFYHGFVLGLMADFQNRYVITSNRESGFGRYDVLLEPINAADDGIILEFKVFNPKMENSLSDTAASALRQITAKKYAAVLEAEGVNRERIRIYGFAFRGKEVLIEGGYIANYENSMA